MTRMSSREFNQDTARAKRAASDGVVVITDRGRPAHVLLTWEAYSRLVKGPSIAELLSQPDGIADIDLPLHRSTDLGRGATFD
jgi:prevent-host-death family protein